MTDQKKYSIATKLNLLIVVTTALAILLVTLPGMRFDYDRSLADIHHLLESHAKVVGSNNTAAIVFDEPYSARESLKSLEMLSGMVMAVIYSKDGKPFASYARPSDINVALPAIRENGFYEQGNYLDFYQAIILDGEEVGNILLRYDMSESFAQLREMILFDWAVGLLAIGFSVLLATRFQRLLVKPIQSLVEVAEKVSSQRDYTARVPITTSDEIGQLADTFNEMLQQVQDRDDELARSHRLLERRVIERTAELTESKELAEQAARSKSQFLAAMSHEIRTPLNGVIGMSSLMASTELSSEQQDSLNTIQRSAESLLTIINDILDFSKIEAGKMELEPINFNLRETLEELLDVMRIKAVEKSIYLQLYIEDGLPEWVVGDPGRIHQVLMNFISNAIKFTNHGGVLVVVSTRLSSEGGLEYCLSVRDTGIGISKDKLGHVFEEFAQADNSTTRKYGGTGLGLSISYLLTQLMGGQLTVESELNKGSIFTLVLSLPRAKNKPVSNMIKHDVLLAAAKVLIVGDTTGDFRVAERWAKRWTNKVTFISSISEAKKRIEVSAFDIIVIDECVGFTDALDYISELRESDSQVVLFMLASLQSDKGAAIKAAGANGYLSWPVNESYFRQALSRCLVYRKEYGEKHSSQDSFVTQYSFAVKDASLLDIKPIDLRILLAEDNIVNQKVAVRMLERLGCIVDVAANGREAIRLWKQLPYDLIFMDCHMPVLDGYEATRSIRQLEPEGKHILIYALTANTMNDEMKYCQDVGMDGFIAKPVRLPELQGVIAAVNEQLKQRV